MGKLKEEFCRGLIIVDFMSQLFWGRDNLKEEFCIGFLSKLELEVLHFRVEKQ